MKKTATAIICVMLLFCVFNEVLGAMLGVSAYVVVGALCVALIALIWLAGPLSGLTRPDEDSFVRRPGARGYRN